MRSVLEREAVAHNSVLSVLVETGWVGPLSFALLLGALQLAPMNVRGPAQEPLSR
jgi:O-antigen ligase